MDNWAAKWTWCVRSVDGNKVVCTVCSKFNNGKEFQLDNKHDNLQKHEFGQPGAAVWGKELASRPISAAASATVVNGLVATAFARVVRTASQGGWERDSEVAKVAAAAACQARQAAKSALKADVAEIAAAKKVVVEAAIAGGYLSQHQRNALALAAAAIEAAVTTVPPADVDIRDHLSNAMQQEYNNKLPQFILLYDHMRHARPFVAYEQLKEPLAMIIPTLASLHWSDNSGVQFAAACNSVVVDYMRADVQSAECCSVSMDEVTDNATQQFLGMQLYTMGADWVRRNHYVQMQKLVGSANADNLTTHVIQLLTSVVGMSTADIASKLHNISCDGAAVLHGKRNGVVTQIALKHAPFVLAIHCFAHRTWL